MRETLMKKIISGAAVLLTCVLVLTVGGCSGLKEFQEEIDSLVIKDIDITALSDGSSTGVYETMLVSAEARVTVSSGRITAIDLLRHENGKGSPAEVITEAVIEQQSLMVDTVSGATASSKVILKAVENALTAGYN